MGNAFRCMQSKEMHGGGSRSRRGSGSKSTRRTEEELLHRHALALAIQQHQLSQRFDGGSMSRRGLGSTSSRRSNVFSESFNTKQHQVLFFPYLFSSKCMQWWDLNRNPSSNAQTRIFAAISTNRCNFNRQVPIFLDNFETKKFVLVHGEGFGAWCWYKTMSLLEESGGQPVALDLTGSGIDHTDPNSITTLADYSKPLIDYLNKLPEDEQVILVGHSCGGASISYALECYPKKISKAVFLSATMVPDGKRPYDVFAGELASADVFMQESQFLLYGNGRDKSPTGLVFDKQQMKGLYFNQSPSKDIALATVSMRAMPLAPFMENLSLTPENYGTVRRYFIQTLDDRMLLPDTQEKLVRENPPHGVFKIKGSDHCPFFSKPQSLNKILLEIASIS